MQYDDIDRFVDGLFSQESEMNLVESDLFPDNRSDPIVHRNEARSGREEEAGEMYCLTVSEESARSMMGNCKQPTERV